MAVFIVSAAMVGFAGGAIIGILGETFAPPEERPQLRKVACDTIFGSIFAATVTGVAVLLAEGVQYETYLFKPLVIDKVIAAAK